MSEDYISITEAARRRNVSRGTIYNAIRDKKITSVEFAGRVAVLADDVATLEVYPPPDQRKGITFPGGRGRPKKQAG